MKLTARLGRWWANPANKWPTVAFLASFIVLYGALTYASYLYLPEWGYIGGPDEQLGNYLNMSTIIVKCWRSNTETSTEEPLDAYVKLYRYVNGTYELLADGSTGDDGIIHFWNLPAQNYYKVEATPTELVDNPQTKTETVYAKPGYTHTVEFSWSYTPGGSGSSGGSAGPGEPAPGHAHLCCRAWLQSQQSGEPAVATNRLFEVYDENGSLVGSGYGHEVWFENLPAPANYTIYAYDDDNATVYEIRPVELTDGEVRVEDFYYSYYASWLLDLVWWHLAVPLLQARLYVSLVLASVIAWQVRKREIWRWRPRWRR